MASSSKTSESEVGLRRSTARLQDLEPKIFSQPVRLQQALILADKKGGYEYDAARPAMIILSSLFDKDIWKMIPEYYTKNKRYPDLALEKFVYRPDAKRKNTFLPRIYIEFKSVSNKENPTSQLLLAITKEHGLDKSSKGFLIGIRGSHWTISDYQYVKKEKENVIELLTLDFFDTSIIDMSIEARPNSSYTKPQKDLSWRTFKGCRDLIKALKWIAKHDQVRDLTKLPGNEAKSLTNTFSINRIDLKSDGENLEYYPLDKQYKPEDKDIDMEKEEEDEEEVGIETADIENELNAIFLDEEDCL